MPMSLLKDSDARFRLMADGAPVMLWISDIDKRFIYFNEGWLRFTGRSASQESGLGWTEGVHPLDLRECLDTFSAASDARQPFRMEFRLRRHDGEYRWVLDSGTPLHGDNGEFQGFVGSCIDVTEIKESREQLTRLVAEKETLLKELHHRVKNNLQMIISYVTLRLSSAKTPEAVAVLKQVVERVTSLALIHQQLVSDGNVNEIDFAIFLRGLTDTMQSVEARPQVKLSLEADPVRLRLEKAMPLALLVNELLSNCYRHAFPNDRDGRIEVRLQKHGMGLVLRVSDDGPGFDAQSCGKGGFGLTLVELLAGQIGSEVVFDRTGGVTVTLAEAHG